MVHPSTALGVGIKATPALLMPREAREFIFDTTSSVTKTMKTGSSSKIELLGDDLDTRLPLQSDPPRQASALHSIMEQGTLSMFSLSDRYPERCFQAVLWKFRLGEESGHQS